MQSAPALMMPASRNDTSPARSAQSPECLSVAFVLAPQFTLLAFSAFVDTLRLAADEGDGSRPILCRWEVLSHDMRPIRASCGADVSPTAEPDLRRQCDYVVLVGGLLSAEPLAPALQQYLVRAASRGIALVGLCTGSFLLAQLGLLQDRRCCISWFHHAEFVARFPHIRSSADVLYVIDQDRLTCAGGTSVVHLASHLVARHCGQAQAAKAMRIMIEEAPLPDDTPQPPPLAGRQTTEIRVRKALLLIERNLDKPVSCSFIARLAGVSSRQLERLFQQELGTTPSAYAMQLRLARAQELLLHSHESVYDIALQCGFVNHSHFARRFRAHFGVAPHQLRRLGDERGARQRSKPASLADSRRSHMLDENHG